MTPEQITWAIFLAPLASYGGLPLGDHRRSATPYRSSGGLPYRRDAAGRNVGQPAGADLFPGLHGRGLRLLPLLRLHVAVHGLHAWPGLGRQSLDALCLLGAGGPLLLFAHWLLVPAAFGGGCRQEGFCGDSLRRPRLSY